MIGLNQVGRHGKGADVKMVKEMTWKDEKGDLYKISYSQLLQRKMLRVNILLLISMIILIVLLLIGFFYAHQLIERIDSLDILSKMISRG